MKKIKSLKFDTGNQNLQKSHLKIHSSNDLLELKNSCLKPALFLIKNVNVDELTQFKLQTVDRKTKHKAKSLSTLLLGYDKIPLIRGSYSDAGQLLRSLRTLLKNAQKRGEDNIYFIGAKDDIFQKLWESTSTKKLTAESSISPDDIPVELKKKYLGLSSKIEEVHRLILLAAKNSEPVLILGETGTGKEIVAQSIHEYSRPGQPFQAINCGAIPNELFESTLFGYMKGSHNLALKDTKGLWESTSEGTLFLDEIGDLSLDHQVKILRVLQEGKIRRIGGDHEIQVNARIITATNKDLKKEIKQNKFREDLLQRIDVISIKTPALRKHPEDIPFIAQQFWTKVTKKTRKPLSETVLQELTNRNWLGNVRELENVIKKIHFMNPLNENIGLNNLKLIIKGSDILNRLHRLADSKKSDFNLDLWVEHGMRDFTPESSKFYLGDRVNICACPDQDCQLWLVNVGTTGEISILSPLPKDNNLIKGKNEVRIPGTLEGGTGREIFYAFAITQPLKIQNQFNTNSQELALFFLTTLENAIRQSNNVAFASQLFMFDIEEPG